MKSYMLLLTILSLGMVGAFQTAAQVKHQKYQVGQRTLLLEDTTRNRKLTTELWYPTLDHFTLDASNDYPFYRIPTKRQATPAKGPFPVILFSHGTGGGRLTLEWFCAGLAAHGFIVAAVDHYGNTFDNPIPEEFVKSWQRPLDLRYVLNQISNLPDLSQIVDSTRIGAAGFSLGGFSVIALAGAQMDFDGLTAYVKTPDGKQEADIPEMPGLVTYFEKPEIRKSFKQAPSLADKRIKSVFVMSPALGQAFPGKPNFKQVHTPVYIVAVGNDRVTPIKTNALHYAQHIPRAQITIVDKQAGHYVFLNEAKDDLKQRAPLFFSDPPSVHRKAIHEKTLELAVEHFRKTLNTSANQ